MSHKKFFAVDDDASILKIYERALRPMLETVGVEVRIFEGPDDVLEAVAEGAVPDLILTDDCMPGMTGTELAEVLRKRGYAGKILMVSGTANAAVLQRGVDELLEKPFGVTDLRNSVRGLLG